MVFFVFSLIISTGHVAFFSTPLLMLPRRISVILLTPLAPMTIKSKCPELAVLTISCTALPSTNNVSTLKPSAAAMFCVLSKIVLAAFFNAACQASMLSIRAGVQL